MNDPVLYEDRSSLDLEAYRKKGYLVVEGVLSEEALEGLRSDVMDLMNHLGMGISKLRQTGSYVKGSCLDALVNSSKLREIASFFLEGQAHVYLPFTAVKSAGGGAFDFHQDNQYTKHRSGGSLNIWVALMDMSVENGCLYVDPGSHKEGTLEAEHLEDGHRKVEPTSPIPMEIKAGSCVVFNRLLVHGSSSNETPEHRLAYAVQYHREDTEAFFDDEWKRLRDEPRYKVAPANSLEEIT